MRHAATCLALFLCSACGIGGSSEPKRRYSNEAQGYVIAQPDGWTAWEHRGFAQLTPVRSKSMQRHTIVIRAAKKPQQVVDGKPTTDADLVAATERVLRALPKSTLSTKAAFDGELKGVRFSLSFVPRGLTRPYRREHALLLGSTHVFHIIYTSPSNEPMDEASFRTVVTTLSEEG